MHHPFALIFIALLCLAEDYSASADSLISVPVANALTKERKVLQGCGAGMFQCPSSGRCIPNGWKCDLEADCEDAEDEKDCVPESPAQCSESEYRCEEAQRTGATFIGAERHQLGFQLGFIHHCIPKEWKCDGEADCLNKDDERSCKEIKCILATHFECTSYDANTTQCIPNDWKCDGTTDCLDGKDEEGCEQIEKKTCNQNEFKCNNGQCIYASWHCDGDNDCNDGSDEENCQQATCDGSSKFKCTSGFCNFPPSCEGTSGQFQICPAPFPGIPATWRCDGEIDCADHSDETDCAATHPMHTVNCTDKEFKCANGAQCISSFWKCDGDADCFDESDELNCEHKEVKCPEGEKQCKHVGECVPANVFCDGYEDCSDGSDEFNCTVEELLRHKITTCNPLTEYACGGKDTATSCIAYKDLCLGSLSANDCVPQTVCNKQIEQCHEGEPHCQCRKTGTNGKVCHCPSGYSYEESAGGCKDIDECNTAGTCDQICTNRPGSYKCDCYPGYKLTHPTSPKNDSISKCRAVGADPLLLLSNRAAIRQYDLTTNKYHPLITKLESAVAMDYWHKNKTLIWSDVSKEEISICYVGKNFSDAFFGVLNDCLEKGNVTLISEDVATPDGLAIDWVHGLLFWTDTGRDEINVLDLNSKHRKTIIKEGLDEPRAIAVDPSLGLIFWTDWGDKPRIERAGMDGNDRIVIVGKDKVSWPNGLALDILDRRVYWADAKAKVISSSDYNGGSIRTVLHSHRHLKHPFSLAVFEERLYFTDWDQEGVLTVNKFGISNDVKVLMKGVSGPMTVRIYHPQAQPEHIDKCYNNKCEQLCLPRAHLDVGHQKSELLNLEKPYRCECMNGFKVSIHNHTTCIPVTEILGAAFAEDASGLGFTYFLVLLVIALAFVLGVMYRRHRPARFTVLNFDNPIYRRTVEDLESDVGDNSLGAISILPADARHGDGANSSGALEAKLVFKPSVGSQLEGLKSSPQRANPVSANSSYVDVHDPNYAYDQPRPAQK